MNSINFISNLFLLLLYKNVTRKWVSFSYNFLNVVMTTFFNITKNYLLYLTQHYLLAKNYKMITTHTKWFFLIKYVLSLRNLLKTGLKGHQMTIKYKILI